MADFIKAPTTSAVGTNLNGQNVTGTAASGSKYALDVNVLPGAVALSIDLRRAQTVLFAVVSATASGANTLVAADGTRKIKVLSYVLVCDGAVTATFKSGSTALSGAMSFVANGGVA